MNIKKIIGVIAIICFCVACNLKNADNIEGPVVYNPTFSFPVGTYNLTYDNLFSNMDLPLADTAAGDSLFLVWFEDHFYSDTVGYYDTTLTVDYSFNFLANNQENIKSILFRLNYLSELPSKSYLQIYFNSPMGLRWDSLFSDGPLLLEPADTNAQGFVENASTQRQDIYFDESRIENLIVSNEIELRVGIQTRRSDIEYFKYLARYRLNLQLGIRVELEAVFE